MKEYNWREEREKYRPDFQKKAPEAPQNNAIEIPEISSPRRGWVIWSVLAVAAIAVIAVIAGVIIWLNGQDKKKPEDPATLLAQAAEKNKMAVGVVVVIAEMPDGRKIQDPIGTAWAFEKNKFATNAHVANAIKDHLHKLTIRELNNVAQKYGYKNLDEYIKKVGEQNVRKQYNELRAWIKQNWKISAHILINSANRKGYAIKAVQIHRDYGTANTSFNPDIAVLTIEGEHDCIFKLADTKTLQSLKAADPIAFIGFPMEYLIKKNINLDNPVASVQVGTVVAVSDFELKDSGPENNKYIRHNLPATGGASGSPIFNTKGEVVAILNAGNIIGQIVNGNEHRAPSAAQINFAIRIDLLQGMGEAVAIKDFIK